MEGNTSIYQNLNDACVVLGNKLTALREAFHDVYMACAEVRFNGNVPMYDEEEITPDTLDFWLSAIEDMEHHLKFV